MVNFDLHWQIVEETSADKQLVMLGHPELPGHFDFKRRCLALITASGRMHRWSRVGWIVLLRARLVDQGRFTLKTGSGAGKRKKQQKQGPCEQQTDALFLLLSKVLAANDLFQQVVEFL